MIDAAAVAADDDDVAFCRFLRAGIPAPIVNRIRNLILFLAAKE